MRIVLDTNVLVSAILSGGGTSDLVLQLVLQREVVLLTDSRITAEYDEVLRRARFGFDMTSVQLLIDTLQSISEPVLSRPIE